VLDFEAGQAQLEALESGGAEGAQTVVDAGRGELRFDRPQGRGIVGSRITRESCSPRYGTCTRRKPGWVAMR
jgi:hypothetical protein